MSSALWTTAIQLCTKDFSVGALSQLLGRDLKSAPSFSLSKLPSPSLLWGMKSRTKDYGMPPLCPWSRETMEYDGRCNHAALAEHITNDSENLTTEQIAAKEVEMMQRRAVQARARTRTNYHELKLNDFEEWKARQTRYAANLVPNGKRRSRKGAEPLSRLPESTFANPAMLSSEIQPSSIFTKTPKSTPIGLLASTESPKTLLCGNFSARFVIVQGDEEVHRQGHSGRVDAVELLARPTYRIFLLDWLSFGVLRCIR
jgi:hypothetical protein